MTAQALGATIAIYHIRYLFAYDEIQAFDGFGREMGVGGDGAAICAVCGLHFRTTDGL